MYDRFGYLACWLPSLSLALGDVGRLNGYRFEKLTSLAELGVSFGTGVESHPVDMEYASADSVTVAVDVAAGVGPAPADGSSQVSIGFGKGGAIFFQATDCVVESVANLPALEVALRLLCDSGDWSRGFTTVTSVIRTGPAVVFIANQRDAHIRFRVGVDSFGVLQSVARAAGTLQITAKSGLEVGLVAPHGLTPLYGASYMKTRLRGKSKLVFKGDDQPHDFELSPVTWADLD